MLFARLERYISDGKSSKLIPVKYIPKGYILPTDISRTTKSLAHPSKWSEAFLAKLIAAIVAARGNLPRLLRGMERAVEQRRRTTGGPNELVTQDLKIVEELLV